MANTNLIHDMVYKEAVRTLRNSSAFINLIEPQYDKTYSAMGAKEGEAIRLMEPAEFTVREGNNISIQDVTEKSKTLSRSVLRGVDFKFSSSEMTQDVDSFNRTKVAPAIATLAAKIDNYCMDLAYKEIYQSVALPVTSVDRQDVLKAGVQLSDGSTPMGSSERCMILNPQSMMDVVDDSSGLFNNASSISQQYDDGIISVPAMGFKFATSQNVPTHTVGAHGGTPVTNGAGTEGATSLVTDGWTNDVTGILKQGDIFTIAAVKKVNPLTKQVIGGLQQFVVTADANSGSTTGPATLSIEPALISTGQYQNIDALPADGAAIVVLGVASTTYAQNLAFHRGFGAIGFIDLDAPAGATIIRKAEDGISMRMWIDRDINTNSEIFRFDVLFGYKTIIPRWASRVYAPAI